MVLLLRVFGVIASINTAIFLFVVIVSLYQTGTQPYALIYPSVHAAFAVLWFWLAARLNARRRREWERRMMLPCQQCGSDAAIGFRVCRTCGRVKAAGI